MKDRNMMKLARLFRELESDYFTREYKIAQIKFMQESGEITVGEAVELAVEYCSKH